MREKLFSVELKDDDTFIYLIFHHSDILCKYNNEVGEWSCTCDVGNERQYKEFTIKRIK